MRTPGDGSCYQTSDGRWRVVVTMKELDSKGRPTRKYLSGGSTQAQAKARLKKAIADRDNGTLVAGREWTVDQWFDHWLEKIVLPNRAPLTYGGYQSTLKVWIRPAIGRYKLSALQPEHLDALYLHMAEQGSRQGPSAHRIIARALKVAHRYGKVGRNVALLVDAPTVEPVDIVPFDLDDAKRIRVAAAKRRNGTRWIIALSLGLRRGEALGLLWDDIDLDEGTMHIRGQLQRNTHLHGCGGSCGRKRGADCPERKPGGGLVLRRTKTKDSKRVVAIPKSLVKALRAHRLLQRTDRIGEGSEWVGFEWGGQQAALVFADRLGKPIDPAEDRDDWIELLKMAKVDYKRIHDARHTAATLLLVLGIDVKVVSALLGHTTVRITQDIYQHVTKLLQREAAEAMEKALWGGSSSGSRTAGRQRTSTGT